MGSFAYVLGRAQNERLQKAREAVRSQVWSQDSNKIEFLEVANRIQMNSRKTKGTLTLSASPKGGTIEAEEQDDGGAYMRCGQGIRQSPTHLMPICSEDFNIQ